MLPAGTATSDAASSAWPASPRTIETMLPASVRAAIGSSASARLGMPMSSRAENTTWLPGAASRHAHEPSKTAMSPSSWRNVMLSAPGSKVSSSVQRSSPARKVTSQRDTARFPDTWVTATLWTAFAEFRIPPEVGEPGVHLAR